jgi:hypothetical protein
VRGGIQRGSIGRIAFVISAIGLLLSGLFVPPARPVEASCSSRQIWLYEHANLTGDSISFCSSIPDLNNVAHTLPGDCAGGLPHGDNWNDCISSYRIRLATSNDCAQTDVNAWWSFPIRTHRGPIDASYNLSGVYNDSMSSVLFDSPAGSIC